MAEEVLLVEYPQILCSEVEAAGEEEQHGEQKEEVEVLPKELLVNERASHLPLCCRLGLILGRAL